MSERDLQLVFLKAETYDLIKRARAEMTNADEATKRLNELNASIMTNNQAIEVIENAGREENGQSA